MKPKTHRFVAAALLLALSTRAETIGVKLATILPKDTGQDIILRRLAEGWNKASGGAVTLKIAPGGQKDGEATIVKKLNSKNYDAALLSAVGLSEEEKDVCALQMMPLVFRNWDEVDFVREKLRGELESELRAKGFVVLFWADAGWVNFFSREKATTPAEFKKLKMFCTAGDAPEVELMKSLGYHPVPLETYDVHASFESRMIDVAPLATVFAMGLQIETVAPHVVDVNWCPLIGAGIIRRDVWEKIPADIRQKLQALCDKAGADLRAEGRRFHDNALATLRKGPNTHVHTLTPGERAQWDALAAELNPKIPGKLVPARTYDEVQQLLKEFRATKTAAQ